ncbi:hypothetical protein Zm00014a_010219 [Zea mays]|uniref:Secreted protein n=1 Tax=Zea mays TaxID=4577 RepID=A0A3L6G560_MAIZE|nr:hypothetical protein Zm00014a_010219 [Zea mays]
MRNNKMLINLAIAGLTSLTRSRNTRKNSSTCEDFDPLYESHHNEDNVHHVADKAVPFNCQRRNTHMCTSSGGTKGSKKVLAPNAEDQVGRITT